MEFKKYKKIKIVELRPVTQDDIDMGLDEFVKTVFISIRDVVNNSPKMGDMIARDPEHHDSQWLVNKRNFKDNFEEI